MGDVSSLLMPRLKMSKCWELCFTVLIVAQMKFIKESPCIAVECAGVEGAGLWLLFTNASAA